MTLEGSKQNRLTERGTRNLGRKRGLTPVMGQVMHERVVVFWVHSLGVGTMVQEHPDQGQLLGPETVTAIQCHRPTVRDEGTLWEQVQDSLHPKHDPCNPWIMGIKTLTNYLTFPTYFKYFHLN